MTVPRPSGTRRKGSSPVGLVKGIPWWQFEGSTSMDPDQIRHAGQERVPSFARGLLVRGASSAAARPLMVRKH